MQWLDVEIEQGSRSKMLRVNSSNVLVVPPWECAWLSDEQLNLQDGAGCICFDVKGEGSVSVCS